MATVAPDQCNVWNAGKLPVRIACAITAEIILRQRLDAGSGMIARCAALSGGKLGGKLEYSPKMIPRFSLWRRSF